MTRLYRLFAALISLSVFQLPAVADTNNAVTTRVAAASSLQFALNEIVDAYIETTGNKAPQLVYGSSGNLFRQIMQGAPFDVFLSADVELINKFQAGRNMHAEAVEIGADQLVLYAKKNVAPDLKDFRTLLDQVENKAIKIAIANPRHAPFGRAAQQALQSLGLWEQVQPRLVFAEKVSQAAQFVAGGATDFAILSQSLALSPALQEAGSFILIPTQYYQPVVQSMVLVTNTESAQLLFNFISESTAAADVFQKFGLH